jgi:ubiquinone/menaquinone biosynthesis C-methylase UbiE
MSTSRLGRVKSVVGRVVEPALYRLDRRYAMFKARRLWDRAARQLPREMTAAQDADNWDVYWASGTRDLDLLMATARRAGPIGTDLALDLGCGLGRVTQPLADHFERVVGVDISLEMVRLARQHSGRPNVSYALVGPESRLPLADGTVDLAVAWTVFRHMAKPAFAQYLDELYRVLKPGGCLAFDAQIRESGPPIDPAPYLPWAEREYTIDELGQYCVDHRLTWGAEQLAASVTPGTSTRIVAWRRV